MSGQEGSCVPDLVDRIVAHIDSLPNVRRCGRQREFFLGFSLAAVSEPGRLVRWDVQLLSVCHLTSLDGVMHLRLPPLIPLTVKSPPLLSQLAGLVR